jgi:hypothetical protein
MADVEHRQPEGQQVLQADNNLPPPVIDPPPPVAGQQVAPPPPEGELLPRDNAEEILNSTTRSLS